MIKAQPVSFSSKYIIHGDDNDRKEAFNKIKLLLFANDISNSYLYPLDIYENKPVNQVMICTNDEKGNDADECLHISTVIDNFFNSKRQVVKIIKEQFKLNPEKLKTFLENFKPDLPENVVKFFEKSPRFNKDLIPELEAKNVNKALLEDRFDPVTGTFGKKGDYKHFSNNIIRL